MNPIAYMGAVLAATVLGHVYARLGGVAKPAMWWSLGASRIALDTELASKVFVLVKMDMMVPIALPRSHHHALVMTTVPEQTELAMSIAETALVLMVLLEMIALKSSKLIPKFLLPLSLVP